MGTLFSEPELLRKRYCPFTLLFMLAIDQGLDQNSSCGDNNSTRRMSTGHILGRTLKAGEMCNAH